MENPSQVALEDGRADPLDVALEHDWSGEESALFGDPLLDSFAHTFPAATDRAATFFAKARRDGELVGVAPLVLIRKYRSTRLIEPKARRWMDPLIGPFARKTTCLVDTALMAFRHEAPFFARDARDLPLLRSAVLGHLVAEAKEVDTIIVNEPWAGIGPQGGFEGFLQLPLVTASVAGHRNFEDYLKALPKKRRRNAQQERKLFADAGGTMEVAAPPHDRALMRLLHAQLMASEARNRALEVPYSEIMNDFETLCRQQPWLILARLDGAIIGFFAFIPVGGVMHQCHGGLDYERAQAVKTYPNLMHAAVEHAIAQGMRSVSFGPLNNEAKRRAGEPQPVMASFWCRDAVSRFMMKNVMMKRFQVYTGPIPAGAAGPEPVPAVS